MLLLRSESLPNDSERWLYELKLDGYQAVAFKRGGTIHSAIAKTTMTSAHGTQA
jgi:hypothetical protein